MNEMRIRRLVRAVLLAATVALAGQVSADCREYEESLLIGPACAIPRAIAESAPAGADR